MHLLRLVLLVAIAPIFFIQGCDSTSNEALPNSGVSLCINLYETCVDPIMHNVTSDGQSCSQNGCHNLPSMVPAAGFGLTPGAISGTAPMMMNFSAVEARTLNNNLLLTRATGTGHPTGGARFNTASLCYNAISEWRSISAPTDGSACSIAPATIPNCTLIMANPAVNVAGCAP